jgi:hypothetical protein
MTSAGLDYTQQVNAATKSLPQQQSSQPHNIQNASGPLAAPHIQVHAAVGALRVRDHSQYCVLPEPE